MSEAQRARVSRGLRRYHDVQREAARVRPADLVALSRAGVKSHAPVRPALLPFLAAGADETAALISQLGGAEALTPARRLLAEDTGRLGALARALVARFAETADSEIASRVATLVNARRQNLMALGLERVVQDVEDLSVYLRHRASAAAASNGSGGDAEVGLVEDRPATGRVERPAPRDPRVLEPAASPGAVVRNPPPTSPAEPRNPPPGRKVEEPAPVPNKEVVSDRGEGEP
jgi:hypothetical protein